MAEAEVQPYHAGLCGLILGWLAAPLMTLAVALLLLLLWSSLR